MLPSSVELHQMNNNDDDLILYEVPLETDKQECALGSLQRRASELGSILWRVSSSTRQLTRYLMMTIVLTKSLVDNLDSECAASWQPGNGPIEQHLLLLARIIDSLEEEQVDEDFESVSITSGSSENSDFVGGNKSDWKADLTFRHQLSMNYPHLPTLVAVSGSNDWPDEMRLGTLK